MVTAEGKIDLEFRETENMIEEFKQKLIQSLRFEKEKMHDIFLQTAREEANNIINDAKKEAQDITREIKDLRQKTATELAEAQNKTAEAIEQILANARKAATEKAEKEAFEITAEAKIRVQREREHLLAEALAEAKTAAETESTRILEKARREAEDIVNATKNKVRVQIEESGRLMLEIQQKIQQVIQVAGIDVKVTKALTSVELMNNKRELNCASSDDESQTYQGELRIDIAPPVDKEQLGILEQYLSKTSGLRVISLGQSEDGSAWIKINSENPMQLLGILRKMPNVKDVVGCKSYVIVALKSKQVT